MLHIIVGCYKDATNNAIEMSTPQVLMFGWEFPPFNSGGLGVACYGLTKALSKQGVPITFVLPRRYSLTSETIKFAFADTNKVVIKDIDSLLLPYSTEESYERERHLYKTALYGNNLVSETLRYGRQAAEIAKNTPHTVIHAHDWLSFPAGMAARKISRKPLIAHIHATEFDRSGGRGANHHVYAIEKQGMKAADKIIAVSNLTKHIITGKYGIPAHKVQVVYNGINLREYNHSLNGTKALTLKDYGYKIVLFTGRLTLQKGPDYFLHTAKKVLEYYHNVVFVIAGSGDMEHQMIQTATQLGISSRVFFTGYLRGKELNNIYRSADLLVMPSVSEPFGITALESIANNTPVLISKQSGVSEVLTHALKTDFWDIDEMANKIVAVLKHPSLRHTLNEYSRRELESINWDRAAHECIQLYQHLG